MSHCGRLLKNIHGKTTSTSPGFPVILSPSPQRNPAPWMDVAVHQTATPGRRSPRGDVSPDPRVGGTVPSVEAASLYTNYHGYSTNPPKRTPPRNKALLRAY